MTLAPKALTALALTVVLGLVTPAGAAVPSAGRALRGLEKQTAKVPRSAVGRKPRAKLLRIVRHARRKAKGKPCTSTRDLKRYRATLKRTRLKRSVKGKRRKRQLNRLARLDSASTAASRSLLALEKTARCGGGVAPSDLEDTKATLLRSDTTGLTVHVELPRLEFVPETEGGRSYVRLAAPGTETPSAPGTPGIPESSHLMGVPDGAGLTVTASNAQAQTIEGVEVFPAQPDVVDQDVPKPDFFADPFVEPPFTLDKQAFSGQGFTDGPTGNVIGQARDLTIGGLHVPLAQYDPSTDALKVFTSIDVDVQFTGGAGQFPPAVGSPWEKPQNTFAKGLLNGNAVSDVGEFVVQPCGEELLVITNPSTRASADTYADARRAAGFLVRVRETGSGAGQIGTTAAQIQTYIRGRLSNLNCVRPSYVTIMGDDELVPTFTNGPSGIPSDNPYSTKNDADELPDVAVGRMLGADSGQIDAALAKIIGYETSPPTGPMLTKALIAAQFQDTDEAGEVNDGQEDRTFIRFAEDARSGLSARGVAVDRIYEDEPNTNPQRFWDGGSLPAELKKPTFAWDGDTADIAAAWNEGRFLAVHRDHGWSEGWSTPEFETGDAAALTNTNANLPVVLSINCASARYDDDETSFTQTALVKPTGGAVGVFGDTRNSPSWHNSELALGFLDGLLPSVLSGEGPAGKQRVGDALITGKLRLVGLAPPSGPGISGGDADTRDELYLWHYFGDPTMQMFGGGNPPITFNPNLFKAVYHEFPPKPGDPPPYEVEVTIPPGLGGQAFSLLRKGEVVGRALAGDGSVKIPVLFNDGKPEPGELQVALDADDAAPLQLPVDGVPPAPELTQQCPDGVVFDTQQPTTVTVTGTLKNAPAGATVSVTFTKPTGTQVVDVTTDAQGDWTASVTTSNRKDIGRWTVASKYAGDSTHKAASAGPCAFDVALP